jgi:hypothetical protein
MALQHASWRAALAETPHPDDRAETRIVLMALLADRQHRALEFVFRLLKLGNPAEDFERIYRGVLGSRTDRASGRELIESLVHGVDRVAVLAMLDAAVDPASGRLPRARLATSEQAAAKIKVKTYAEVLEEIVSHSNGILQTVALRHATEIGLASAKG